MSTVVHIPSEMPAGRLTGALVEPVVSAKVGGVVVVHEFWGLSDYIVSVCDRLAAEGFVALAPDLFDGKKPATKPEAAGLMKGLDTTAAVAGIASAARYLKAAPRGNGRVAVIGFCMGGGLALDAARALPELDAAVCFYGLPRTPVAAMRQVTVPIQAHFASRDEWAKATIAEDIRAQVTAGGGSMEVFEYDAGHAFMRWTEPSAHHEESARVAWGRMVEFLKGKLASHS